MKLKLFIIAIMAILLASCSIFERVPRYEREENQKVASQSKPTKGKNSKSIKDDKQNIISNKCVLKEDEVLSVACTYGCNNNNKKALEMVAKELGYQLEFKTLNRDNSLKGYQFVDAIVIEGGHDIQPYLYDRQYGKKGISGSLLSTINPDLSEEEKIEWKNKDVFEYKFLKKYFKEDKFSETPILGICRGLQMLSVASGIPLYVDIKKQINVDTFVNTVEEIEINEKDSLIGHIMGVNIFEGLQAHHQGVHYQYYLNNKKEFPHISVTATSQNNKIVEAMEFYNRKVLGVQFHPERSNKNVKRRVFSWLLNSACQGKKARKDIK